MRAVDVIRAAGIAEAGRSGQPSEDAVLCLPDAGLFCVADGFGGTGRGDVASKAVVEALATEVTRTEGGWPSLSLQARVARVRVAADRASLWIRQRMREGGFARMGSTLVALVLDPEHPWQGMAIHAGHSRLYRFHAGRLARITEDHTYGSELGTDGGSELPRGMHHVLTSGVGLYDKADLEAGLFTLKTGDLVVLCTASLTRRLSERVIHRVIRRMAARGGEAVARALVDEAMAAGSEDSIAVVVVDPGTVPAAPQSAQDRTRRRLPRGLVGGRTLRAALVALLLVTGAVTIGWGIHSCVQHDADRTQQVIGPRHAGLVPPDGQGRPAGPAAASPSPIVPFVRPTAPATAPASGGVPEDVARVEAPAVVVIPLASGLDPDRVWQTGQWESPAQLAAWAAGEDYAVARLGDLNRRLPALVAAIEGRSSVTNVADALGAFAEFQKRSTRVRLWAAERDEPGRAVAAADYPYKEVRVSLAAGDLAWQQLCLMIEAVGEAAAVARPRADNTVRPLIDRVLQLQQAVMDERATYADVGAWRHRGDLARVGALLAAVETWMKAARTGTASAPGRL